MNHREERQKIREMERIFHFCGNSFFDEVSPTQRSHLAEIYSSWILRSHELVEAFEEYNPSSVTLTWTFETRISGLAAVIANYISGNGLFDRRIVTNVPEFQESQFFRHDPYFGVYVDGLIGKPTPPEIMLSADLGYKDVIKIADFACAPKKEGSSILFLKRILPKLFPNKRFEFYGYDIDFQDRYPHFDENGNFNGWQEGYLFDEEGVAQYNGATYYNNAAQNPQFNLVPQRGNNGFANTFDVSHNRYDVIINSMFYSVLEMNREPEESLSIMRDNLVSLRIQQGVVFLNTCDDCFKIFPGQEDGAYAYCCSIYGSSKSLGG